MIPVCLITGFLGSGKTTFLRKILKKYNDRTFVYLVNEFSKADIDGELIETETPDIIRIPGGSIFCKCLVTEFISKLRDLPERFPGIEALIIEASGIADPKVIQVMLEETKLDSKYKIETLINLVDPGKLPKLIKTLPNIKAQLEASDRAIINKTDIYSPETIKSTENEIRKIKPDMSIHFSTFGDFDFDIFKGGAFNTNLKGEYAKCADPNFDTLVLDGDKLSPDSLKKHLAPYEDDIYRLKGFIKSDRGGYYIDFSGSGWNISERHLEENENLEIALIVKKGAKFIIANCLEKFKKTQ